MNIQNIDEILQSQKEFFQSGKTLPVSFRVDALKKLRESIKRHEDEIAEIDNLFDKEK